MKNILPLLLILFVTTGTIIGQELEPHAVLVKEKFPEDYEGIKKFSISKWDDNHRMILHEINQQTEAYISIFKDMYSDETLPIFHKALKKWGYDGVTLEGSSTINWRMVKHEMEKQIKSKGAY